MRAYDVILIEVVNSTTSPPNSIALKCKIPHDPPHTNSCICFFYIYYQFSTTSCQLLLSPQYQFCHRGHSIMLKIVWSCVQSIGRSFWKMHLSFMNLPEVKIVSNKRHGNVNLYACHYSLMWRPIRTDGNMDTCTKSSNKMPICLILTADNIFRSKFAIRNFRVHHVIPLEEVSPVL